MDLDAIAVFVKVVQAGSFSGAARLMNMPKTTVSAKIAALEKRLGVSLIQRTTRKLHVTEAGELYFRHCVNAVQEVELGEAALLSSRSRPTGLLRVTASVDVGHTILPPITRAFLEKYPQTNVEMVISNRVLDLIAEGIDLAIRVGTLKDSSLIAKRFFELHANIWASPAYLAEVGKLMHPRDLAKCRFISHPGMKTLQLTNGRTVVQVPVAGRVIADDMQTIKSMLILGEGIGWLPDFLAADAVEAGTLVPVFQKWKAKSAGGFYFVYPGQRYASPKVQAFIETALAHIN